ncbi:NADH dehydrogenase 29/21K chain precursor [Viridothelium virens]|uniref:NADH dehydrogenase 29/21K chain n=1 Tax=Viridothelium virens TaxID=1048519 RepID=A0A6A6GW92_VIRVR|nr:NADH dehydrogenase 29/21K chain precursor [Viridothelium virens]
MTPRKYTVQPQGWGAWISSKLSIDPKRSSGIPLNPQFRNPPPGANDPRNYDDPVTVPAADLAENPYWKRDVRRQYPKLSVVNQGDVVGLLTVGSKATPKDEVLKIGDAGQKQLVEVKEEGQRGLSKFFEKDEGKKNIASILGPGGLPPLPSGLSPLEGGKRYEILKEQTYGTNYPCRTFE